MAVYFIGTIFNKIIVFLLLPIYTANFDPASYGDNDLSMTTVTMLASLLFMEVWTPLLRFSYDEHTLEGKQKIFTNVVSLSGACFPLYIAGCVLIAFWQELPNPGWTAPMYQVARELAAAGVRPDVFFGFRDAPYCMEEYRSIANLVKVSTDTGAVGFHGFVTQLYDPADYDVVLVCGPTVMMKNAARLCAEKGTPCFVSMEKKMACGIGACLGCTCETRGGEGRSVCKNGPVFDATEVFF